MVQIHDHYHQLNTQQTYTTNKEWKNNHAEEHLYTYHRHVSVTYWHVILCLVICVCSFLLFMYSITGTVRNNRQNQVIPIVGPECRTIAPPVKKKFIKNSKHKHWHLRTDSTYLHWHTYTHTTHMHVQIFHVMYPLEDKTHMHTHTHVCIHTHMHTHMHTHTHAHTHDHITHVPSPSA